MKYIIVILFLIFSALQAMAETHEAASCGLVDVQAAVNAALDGDIVHIPVGECTWTSRLTISGAKGLHLRGRIGGFRC